MFRFVGRPTSWLPGDVVRYTWPSSTFSIQRGKHLLEYEPTKGEWLISFRVPNVCMLAEAEEFLRICVAAAGLTFTQTKNDYYAEFLLASPPQ